MSAATARRVFSTLRTALNAAVREGLIPQSPARYVVLPSLFAVVWTKRRVEEWKRTGERRRIQGELARLGASAAGWPENLGGR